MKKLDSLKGKMDFVVASSVTAFVPSDFALTMMCCSNSHWKTTRETQIGRNVLHGKLV